MGYRHIENLYKNQTILFFKECYALEKVHGTSAHFGWKDGGIRFFSGGAKRESFVSLFNEQELAETFREIGHDSVTVYGEAYGGKMQAMAHSYGPDLRFIAFEVQVGEVWLNVENAASVASRLRQEFVPFERIPCSLDAINAERDRDSVVAIMRGCGPGKIREGVVLRPIEECLDNRGNRIMAKHKRDEFMETKTPREVGPEKHRLLVEANDIANEWVTDMRLRHVLDALGGDVGMERTRDVIAGMIEDVEREASGEIITGDHVRRAIGAATAKLLKKTLQITLANKENSNG